MTHEELLAKIDEPQNWHQQFLVRQALRSVVELHKPVTSIEGEFWCRECTEWESLFPVNYPCPTIRTIEKEL